MEEIKLAVINKDGYTYMHEVDDNYHACILYNYIKDNYSEEELKEVSLSDTANIISSYLASKGNAVFLNTTNYKENCLKKYGKSGIYVMPESLNEAQIDAMYEFSNYTKDYDSIDIWYDFKDKSKCRRMYTMDKEQVKSIIDDYINDVNVPTKLCK